MEEITKGYPNWDIPLNKNIREYNDTIGTEEMGTTSTTVKGAIKELKKSIDSNKTELSDKVQTNTADISNLKTKNTEISTQLNDLVNNKIDKSKILNNCSATEEGFVLDARQGKALNDKFDKIKSFSIVKILTNNTNVEITLSGVNLKYDSFIIATNGDYSSSTEPSVIGVEVVDSTTIRLWLDKVSSGGHRFNILVIE